MRRCLGCPRLVARGSRCGACARAYRSPYSRHGWAERVKARDGHRCTVPGCATPTDRIQADHVVPLGRGGRDTLANGRTLCHAHHTAKHRGTGPA